MALAPAQVRRELLVEADEQHLLPARREPLGALDGDHRLARPGAAVHGHARRAPVARDQPGLLGRERHERLLLLEELLGHRHPDLHLRRQRPAHEIGLGRDALVARAAVEGERPLERARHVLAHVDAVPEDLARGVRRQHELVDGDVRERERVDDVQPAAGTGGLLELAPDVVAVVERQAERVADRFGLRRPVPRPVPALEPAALDLQADDAALGVAQHEVALVVERALRVVAQDEARRVEDAPVVAEAGAQRVEHLRSALDFRSASCRVRGYMTAMALETQRPSTRFLAPARQITTVLHDRPTG
ncbi:MAG TPA: hypothetical protein VM266_08740 [Solirubrobacteraceae bacterium]|nr:hypothetical protein [Solirubrobacteraceae bacterium]